MSKEKINEWRTKLNHWNVRNNTEKVKAILMEVLEDYERLVQASGKVSSDSSEAAEVAIRMRHRDGEDADRVGISPKGEFQQQQAHPDTDPQSSTDHSGRLDETSERVDTRPKGRKRPGKK